MAETVTQPTTMPTSPTQPASETVAKKPVTDAAGAPNPSTMFQDSGVSFRAKVIGIEDVPESRGDKMCQDTILKLKGNVKVSGQHKQKIVINISMNGIKLIDLMTAQVLHEHRVDRISFIARDLTDRRAFGYIVGDDAGNHQFYAIKTAKIAEQVVLVLRDLFQVVYNMKQKEVETAKAQSKTNGDEQSAQKPVSQTTPSMQKSDGILNLEQQLENMQQMSDMDAFKTSWPANSPTTPDTSNTGTDSDMFGMANLSDISSLSSDFSLQSSTNDSAKFKDSKNRSQSDAQVQEFRRRSSQKSAASWNGTTSNTSGFTQRRYASLTVSRAKDLKDTLPELTITPLPHTNQTSPKTNNTVAEAKEIESTTQNESTTSSPDKRLEKNSPDSLSVGDNVSTKSRESELAENSFFEEVMAATGLSTDRSTDIDSEDKSKVEMSNDAHSSMSSISSSGSKRSQKSRSINNLFFGKSEKNKSSTKRKNKVSRQSSSSSVTSVTERPRSNTTDAISDSKSIGPDNTHTVTSSASSLRSHRKSSSSSTTSFDRVSREHPVSHSSPKTEEPPNKSRSVRIRPSAAVARARPRAVQPQTTSSNPKNPPMFKTKSRTSNDVISESKEPAPDKSVDSPASVRSSQSITSKEDAAHSLNSTDTVNRIDTVVDTWACFDENSGDKFQKDKTEDPFAFADSETSNAASKKQSSDAWNAFGDSSDERKEKSKLERKEKSKLETNVEKKAEDAAFPSEPFSSEQDDPFASREFGDNFKSDASPDQAWNAFKNKPEEKSELLDKKEFGNSDFSEDPFSTNADSAFSHDDFESCDPFAETNAALAEDPFQNFEAVFRISTNENTEDSHLKTEEKNAKPQVSRRSPSIEFKSDDPFQNVDTVFGDVFDKAIESDKSFKTDEKLQESLTTDINYKQPVDLFENFEAVFGISSDSKTSNESEPEYEDKSANLYENQSFSETAATNSKDPFYHFESVFDVASTKMTTDESESNKNENFMPKDNLSIKRTPPLTFATNQVRSSPSILSRTSSVSSRKSSFHSSASSKRTASPCPKETVQFAENSSWATFPPDQSDIFDNVPFKCDTPANNSFAPSFPPPSSPPPPLPPRPPKRISTSEDETPQPPAIPPPPLPTRPRRSSKIVEENSSSSESEPETSVAPPTFLPPQLPPNLQSNYSGESNHLMAEFTSSIDKTFEASFSTSFPPLPSSHDEKNAFDLPFINNSPTPPAIPKRNLSKRTTKQSPIYENNVFLQEGVGGQSAINRNASYSDDLAGFNMEALQPAANGGAKLTKDQILAGFGQGQASSGMYQQPQATTHPFSAPQGAYSSPPMSPTFGAQFGASPQVPMAGFPMGPRPAVPVRSGAMKPPAAFRAQAPPAQNPFGDAQTPLNDVLAPVNMQPDLTNGSTKEEKPKYDPFASVLPDMGKTDKKDMFKNFKMAKPSSKSDLQQENINVKSQNESPAAGDPFASMTNSNFGVALNADNNQQPQQANNFDSLFG